MLQFGFGIYIQDMWVAIDGLLRTTVHCKSNWLRYGVKHYKLRVLLATWVISTYNSVVIAGGEFSILKSQSFTKVNEISSIGHGLKRDVGDQSDNNRNQAHSEQQVMCREEKMQYFTG